MADLFVVKDVKNSKYAMFNNRWTDKLYSAKIFTDFSKAEIMCDNQKFFIGHDEVFIKKINIVEVN